MVALSAPIPKQAYWTVIEVLSKESFEVTDFHCPTCGALLKKSKGKKVVKLFEGEVLEAGKYDEILCRRCRTLYRFL